MSTRTRARHVRPCRLIDPPDREGTCGTCHAINVLVDGEGRLISHTAGTAFRGTLRVCPGTGTPATDVHDRPYFYVEGVQFL